MGTVQRYELTFARRLDRSGQTSEDVVVVHETGARGPGGHPVYCDESGIVRAEISDRGEVRMLTSGVHQDPSPPTAIRRLP